MSQSMEESDMRERLARIEANQTHLGKQIDTMVRQGERVVHLLDRLVRVEEHVNEHNRGLTRIYTRLERVEEELDTWKSVRSAGAWLFALVSAVGAVIVAYITND